jgi:hypothetical protein
MQQDPGAEDRPNSIQSVVDDVAAMVSTRVRSACSWEKDPMRRREFFKLIGGGAGFCFWAHMAAAQ